MSFEHIVADFETCKKAAVIGLDIKSVFPQYPFPAPTAEEVPLPILEDTSQIEYDWAFNCDRKLIFFEKSLWTEKGKETLKRKKIDDFNEATARLKMAIWLIENVPEARQWYIDNGYLKEVSNDRD